MDCRTITEGDLLALMLHANDYPSEVGERLQWFLYYVQTCSVIATCQQFSIARTTFYRWLRRFDPARLESLIDMPNCGQRPGQPREVRDRRSSPAGSATSDMPVAIRAVGEPPTGRLSPAASYSRRLCRLQSVNWASFRSAAFITSIVFNLALAALIVFTAMVEGQTTHAKATPATLIPAEQNQTSFINTLLGIGIADAATGIYRPINYQGKLTNSGGVAIANGNYDMRFKIFSAASGGNPVWSETWNAGNQKVTATGGLFSIALGTHTAMTGSVDFNSDSLFLQVEFDPGADGVFEEVFSPRRRFASVPYALNANALNGLSSTQFIRSDISYTSSGTLTVSPRDATKIGIDILSTAGKASTGALRLSTQGANHIVFGSGGLNYDTNLYRSAASSLKTDGSFTAVGTISGSLLTQNGAGNNYFRGNVGVGTTAPKAVLDVVGTISGATLVVSGNGAFSGALVVNKSISGAALEVLGTASGQNLFATRSISGTYLYAASTFGGAGLASCNNASTSKLLYNAATKQFSCGTDQTGGSAGTASFSGSVLSLGDARYVKKQGDTMTGALTINLSSGYLGLKILQTGSGNVLHAEKQLSSSGTIVATGTIATKGTLSGAALTVMNGTSYLMGNVGVGTTSPAAPLEIVSNGVWSSGLSNNLRLVATNYPTMRLYSTSPNKTAGVWSVAGSALHFFTGGIGDAFGIDYLTVDENGIGVIGGITATAGGRTFSFTGASGIKMITTGGIAWSNFGTNSASIPIMGWFDSSNTEVARITGAGLVGIGTTSPKAKLDVVGTVSGSTVYATNQLLSSGTIILHQSRTQGSGALVVLTTARNATGAYLFSSGGTVLALMSNRGNGTGGTTFTPHILLGYGGHFDTNLYRSGTGILTTSGSFLIRGGTGRTLLKLESKSASQSDNIIEAFSDNGLVGGNPHNRVFRLTAGGNAFADGSFTGGGADYAERFLSSALDLKPGEAVCLDPLKENTVKRCDRDGDANIMGILSTKPAFVGDKYNGAYGDGKNTKDSVLVGLIGQLPAKAIVEGTGSITVGDALAAAAKPGFVRKSKPGESTVGVALTGLASGQGTIDVLITRRNQSDLVAKIDGEVASNIAALNIGDKIGQMVQSSLANANISASVAQAVQAQLTALNVTDQVNRIIDARMADGSLTLNANGSLVRDILSTIGTNSGSATIANAVAARLGLARTASSALIASSDLMVHGALTVQRDTTVSGTLHAAALNVSGLSVLRGPLVAGPLSITGSTVQIGSLTASGGLHVIGPITVQGLAAFLGDVQVTGALTVSGTFTVNNRQAGYAVIPSFANSVTVPFDNGFTAAPVVAASADVPVLFAVSHVTATGFTIRLAAQATERTTISWVALAVKEPKVTQGLAGSVPVVPFHVDAQGRPFSLTDTTWNTCIRDVNALDLCRGYHQGPIWFAHPDIVQAGQDVKSFSYDPTTTPPALVVPPGYAITVVESPSTSSSASSVSSAPSHSQTSLPSSAGSSSAPSSQNSLASSVTSSTVSRQTSSGSSVTISSSVSGPSLPSGSGTVTKPASTVPPITSSGQSVIPLSSSTPSP